MPALTRPNRMIPCRSSWGRIAPLIGDLIDFAHTIAHWDRQRRLVTIHPGTMPASAMVRGFDLFSCTHDLTVGLREVLRLERPPFTLDWIRNLELRRCAHAGLNRGEARNTLARARSFNCLGGLRHRPSRSRCSTAPSAAPKDVFDVSVPYQL